MNHFGDLHSHSDYSIFDGFAKIDDKIQRAKELGYTALAMTEHGTTTGLMEFYLKCKKEGLLPILGYEGYFTNEPDINGGETYHIILLAKNLEGYKNILRLATYGSNHFYRKPRIGIEALRKYHEGVICSTACVAGVLSAENYAYIANELSNIFGDDFYLEIQPHNFPEQHEYNLRVLELSNTTGIPMIITGDSHYVWKSDCETHRQWLGLSSDSEYYGSGDYHMMSKQEMIAGIPNIDKEVLHKCMENVSEIIEKCSGLEIPMGEHNFPVFDTKDPEEYVRKRCREGWVNKGVAKLPNKDQYGKQVNHELAVLNQCGYMNYMCIIDDMLEWCRDNEVPVGVGRGSVGGSLVAYLMNITDVDPIKYNLIFERFANPERTTECDIDTDVSSLHRDDVINYIKEKYGEVFQIRTISYLNDKLAVQKAGMVLGIDLTKRNAISKNINKLDELPDGPLKDLAKKFYGHIASYGKHASAVVVFPKEVSNWCAVEKQGDDFVAAQDYHLLEKQGIMKLDILGLKTLDVIENTLQRINGGLDLASIDMYDKKTGDMLRAGLTAGCFQIESSQMTEIIQKIHTKSVHDTIDTVAICRPGVLDNGMDKVFERRRNGEEEVTYLHPKLEPILKDTEGVILYQEQIMQIAQTLCGYSYGKADNIRRIIGRKIVDEMQPVIDEMLEAGVANGISEPVMKEICDMIVKFANYGFNRGHSAAYGITAWRTAYLKAHYTADFMCSLLDSVATEKDKLATYILHCKDLGLQVLPPNIKYSQSYCISRGKRILLGFNCISGIGDQHVPNGEEPKQYILDHINLNKRVLKNLVSSGAFDMYAKCSRYELLAFIDWAKDKRKSKPPFKYGGEPENADSYGQMEFNMIGLPFTDAFAGYDTSLEREDVYIGIVSKVKAHKTKKGKPMAFVDAITKHGVENLTIFGDSFKELERGSVYLFKVQEGIIRDFITAKKRAA